MKKLWKQFVELVIALKNSLAIDIFTEARFKIAFLFFIMGLVIFGVAGYLVYTHSIVIVQNVIRLIQQMIATQANPNQILTTAFITQTVENEISQMNFAIGFWIILTIVVSAYVLAGIALYPIRKAMEKQRQFIANVAHELRTPLSVMRAETEVTMLQGMTATHNVLMETIASNLEEIDRMSKITKFLLDFSHLESRLATLELSRVDLAAVVVKAVRFMQKFAAERHVALHTGHLAHVVIREGNATALEEMIVNLLKNALNYTPPNGAVTVGLARTVYRGAVLTIQDTGIGISDDDAPYLFEPFYRGRNAHTAHEGGGMGLGLTIVKEIVSLHHATITVKSVVGAGTTVSVRFSPFTVRESSS